MAKREKKDEPWIDNYPPLAEWLKKHEAVCVHQLAIGDARRPSAYLEKWLIRGDKVLVIEVRERNNGWELYTPDGGINIADSLADAERRLKL